MTEKKAQPFLMKLTEQLGEIGLIHSKLESPIAAIEAIIITSLSTVGAWPLLGSGSGPSETMPPFSTLPRHKMRPTNLMNECFSFIHTRIRHWPTGHFKVSLQLHFAPIYDFSTQFHFHSHSTFPSLVRLLLFFFLTFNFTRWISDCSFAFQRSLSPEPRLTIVRA